MGCLVRERHIIELHAVDEPRNRLRRYRLVLGVDPYADVPYLVVAQWGRLRGKLRTRSYEFLSEEKALSCCRAILGTRKRHGYRVTHVDKRHPLVAWMESIRMPKDVSSDAQLRLFDTGSWEEARRPYPSAVADGASLFLRVADDEFPPPPLAAP